MNRYLLDTCALIWYLNKEKRMADIAYDIEYYLCDAAVSATSIAELLYLIQSGKLKIGISFDELIQMLKSKGINLYTIDFDQLEELSRLPFYKKHQDPFDRLIISHAIADNRTLISGD